MAAANSSMNFFEHDTDQDTHYCVEKHGGNLNHPNILGAGCSVTPEGNAVFPDLLPTLARGAWDTRESVGCQSRTNALGTGHCIFLTTVLHKCGTGANYHYDIYDCNTNPGSWSMLYHAHHVQSTTAYCVEKKGGNGNFPPHFGGADRTPEGLVVFDTRLPVGIERGDYSTRENASCESRASEIGTGSCTLVARVLKAPGTTGSDHEYNVWDCATSLYNTFVNGDTCIQVSNTEHQTTDTYTLARVKAYCPEGSYLVRHRCGKSSDTFHYAGKHGDDGYSSYIMETTVEGGYSSVIRVIGVECEYYHEETWGVLWEVERSTSITAEVWCAKSDTNYEEETRTDVGYVRSLDINSDANLPDRLLYEMPVGENSIDSISVDISGADNEGNGDYRADQFECELSHAFTNLDDHETGNNFYKGNGWIGSQGRPEYMQIYCRPDGGTGPTRMPPNADLTIRRGRALDDPTCYVVGQAESMRFDSTPTVTFTMPNTISSLRGDDTIGAQPYWTTVWEGYKCQDGNVRWVSMETEERYVWDYSEKLEGRSEWVGDCGVSPTEVTLPTKFSDTDLGAKFWREDDSTFYFTLPNTMKSLGYQGQLILTWWKGRECGTDALGNTLIEWYTMETRGKEVWYKASYRGDHLHWFGSCGVSPTMVTVPFRWAPIS